MHELKTVTLQRTREQWEKCDPEAMCHMSQAAIFHALTDAKRDVIALHDALAAAPTPAAQSAGQEAGTFEQGLEAAATWLEKRAADYADEFGSVDPDTETLEFGSGPYADLKHETHYEWIECAENIRKIAAPVNVGERSNTINTELLEALIEITADYAERFDLESPSTNPGIKSSIEQARSAISKARAMEAAPVNGGEREASYQPYSAHDFTKLVAENSNLRLDVRRLEKQVLELNEELHTADLERERLTPHTADVEQALDADERETVERPAPFGNCQFHECDLPGQCVGEGKCHHPKRAADAPQVVGDS